ncbi:MAG: hypothetical protein ACRD5K_20445, partial [Candidatus Acidiferrales bacterium]
KPRLGRRVGTVELTPQGERLIGKVLPKQEGMLPALMGELDSREIESLIRICGKLRREDAFDKVSYGAVLIRASEEFDGEEQSGEDDENSKSGE